MALASCCQHTQYEFTLHAVVLSVYRMHISVCWINGGIPLSSTHPYALHIRRATGDVRWMESLRWKAIDSQNRQWKMNWTYVLSWEWDMGMPCTWIPPSPFPYILHAHLPFRLIVYIDTTNIFSNRSIIHNDTSNVWFWGELRTVHWICVQKEIKRHSIVRENVKYTRETCNSRLEMSHHRALVAVLNKWL